MAEQPGADELYELFAVGLLAKSQRIMQINGTCTDPNTGILYGHHMLEFSTEATGITQNVRVVYTPEAAAENAGAAWDEVVSFNMDPPNTPSCPEKGWEAMEPLEETPWIMRMKNKYGNILTFNCKEDCKPIVRHPSSAPGERKETVLALLRVFFDSVDTNADGSVDKEELKAAAAKSYEQLNGGYRMSERTADGYVARVFDQFAGQETVSLDDVVTAAASLGPEFDIEKLDELPFDEWCKLVDLVLPKIRGSLLDMANQEVEFREEEPA